MLNRNMLPLDDPNDPQHPFRLADHRKPNRVGGRIVRESIATAAGVAAITQVALDRLVRFDNFSGMRAANPEVQIDQRPPRRMLPATRFIDASKGQKKRTRHIFL